MSTCVADSALANMSADGDVDMQADDQQGGGVAKAPQGVKPAWSSSPNPSTGSNVCVVARVRPLNSSEVDEGCCAALTAVRTEHRC